MVENFVRRLSLEQGAETAREEVVRQAAFEVGRPIVFGVAIIVAVYIPIFTLQGIEGRMFRPMAFTVCAAVLGSLLLALTYVPAVASYIFVRRDSRHDNVHEDAAWFRSLRARYQRALHWALAHRLVVFGTAVTLLAVSLGSVPFLGTEFMPKLDEGYTLIESRRIPSASLPQGVAISTEVERTLKTFPEVRSVVTNLGRPQEATESMALNQADVYVTFRPKEEWRVKSLDALVPKRAAEPDGRRPRAGHRSKESRVRSTGAQAAADPAHDRRTAFEIRHPR